MTTTSAFLTMYNQNCIECGVCFGVPNSFDEERRRDGNCFYCPNGHSQHYSDTRERQLARELAKKDQQLAASNEEIKRQRQRVSAQKRIVTRLKKKVALGTCPCCDKLFPDLSSHIATEHPDFEGAAEAEEKEVDSPDPAT